MKIPMPSPNGTNHAGLFINAHGPRYAFDARPRYARDQAPEKDHLILSLVRVIDELRPKGSAADQEPDTDIPDKLHALSEHLQGTMKHDDFKEAEKMIVELIERCGKLVAAAHENENRSNATTGNGPPEFEGKPRTPAMDAAALDSFNERYPMAKRVGQAAPYGEQPAQRHRAPSSAAFNSFAKRFPDAMKIGNL